MTGQIHHIELNVSDWKKSVKLWGWFLKKLGYEVAEKWDAGRSYKLGRTLIAFVQVKEEHSFPPYHRKRVGMNHLAFYAKSRKQVDEVLKELKKKKIPVLYEDRFPNDKWYAVFFEDPDRIKVELVAK
jgi:catechol 2,3-dioxygenase-like lactoylglutathione lyase family enzyme